MSGLKDILLNVGAVAGFAAILGLAVLAMLYFSQARDLRRLREWAGREPERAAEVELRAQQIASQAIAQAYESMAVRESEAAAAAQIAQDAGFDLPPPASVPPAAATPPAGTEPSVPVSEQTQAHDVVAHEFNEQEAVAEPPYEVAAASAAAGETIVQPPPGDQPPGDQLAGVGESGGQARADASPQPPAPEASAADAPPTEQPAAEPVLPQPSTPAAARASTPLPPLPPLDTSEFAAVHTPTPPPIPDYYLTSSTASGRFEPIEPPSDQRSRVPFAVAGVLVALFAVVLIATQLLGGNETATTKGTGGSPNNRPQVNTSKDRNQRINRAAVTVAVLNGTDTPGIAATAAAGLNKAGFTDTTTGNLSDGSVHPTSTVYYASGSKPEAQEVAKELEVTDIQPAPDSVIAAGGSVPVIVVLGANFQQ